MAETIPPIRSRRGPRRPGPGKLHGDKADDHRSIRSYLQRRQITARLGRRGAESSDRLVRHRRVIEGTVA
ncbi:hypothetical protein [Streptomyces sp. NRRL S-350]|uniref:hypothetical protein n=1 Tax=Streptomyces sp. NRRL S-350 TaxID=1463902 RepID=UPI00099D5BA9|nr:hypothetical protein [Streptomyces sp. NRRL S-350]